MNREEAKKIVRIICTTYPNYHPDDLVETVEVWALMLKDFTYREIEVALKAYILTDTSGFAPSVGALVAKVRKNEIELNEMEAWSLVSKAIRNGINGAETEFAKLPPIVQKAVGAPSNLRQWAQTDVTSVENVIQSNFIKTYRSIAAREQELQKLPQNIRMALAEASGRCAIEQKKP